MPALALGLYLVWLAVCFGLRTAVHRRRTGSAGFVMQGEPWTVEWWSRLAFVAALVLGLVAPVAQLLGLDPVGVLDHGAAAGLGIVLALLGIALTFVAQTEMGDSWRVGVNPAERTALVRSGLFRYVRNPIFTAMGTTALGIALIVPTPPALAALVLLVAGLQLQVRLVEEPYLRATHGVAYDSYAGAVGRFVPGVGRQESAVERSQ